MSVDDWIPTIIVPMKDNMAQGTYEPDEVVVTLSSVTPVPCKKKRR
jgi:hypothetical protein